MLKSIRPLFKQNEDTPPLSSYALSDTHTSIFGFHGVNHWPMTTRRLRKTSGIIVRYVFTFSERYQLVLAERSDPLMISRSPTMVESLSTLKMALGCVGRRNNTATRELRLLQDGHLPGNRNSSPPARQLCSNTAHTLRRCLRSVTRFWIDIATRIGDAGDGFVAVM